MDKTDIDLLYDYNYWANQRILTAAERVTSEQFVAPAEFPYGGLRGTLVHILDAEFGWRRLLEHQTESPDLAEADFPTFDSLTARWREEELAMRHYLSTLADADVTGLAHYTNSKGVRRERVRGHFLVHLVNHGTQHRSEAAALLTRYGQSPGDLDFTLFLRERG